MTLQRKVYTVAPRFKAEQEGALDAEFAALNVIDLDGDVTLPGAFGAQEVRMQPYAHNMGVPSIGKGSIREEGDSAIFSGLMNLEMQSGRETYLSLKFDAENGTPMQEWSYIFDIVESEPGKFNGQNVRFLKRLKVHSVDPVFLGAGIGTRTLAVKERKALRLPEGMSVEDLQDGLRTAIIDLYPGFFGGEESWCWVAATYERTAIFNAGDKFYETDYSLGADGIVSLAGQLREMERVVSWEATPPGKAEKEVGMTYADHAEHVLADVQAFVARSRGLVALREKQGRALGPEAVARLTSLREAVEQAAPGIAELLAAPGTAKTDQPDETPKSTRTALALRMAELEQAKRELGVA